jgi:voltage-dependent potassium channel beta subunit
VEIAVMDYKNLGKSGLKVSILSLGTGRGTWGESVDYNVAEKCWTLAYESGINLIDTAENYGNGEAERMIGKIFKMKKWARDTIVISSKVFYKSTLPNQRGLSRKRIREACDASLKRLHMDYIDLYHCHDYDPDTPLEETIFAMNQLIQSGKILYWGMSNWKKNQVIEAMEIAVKNNLIRPTMNQLRYNIFDTEAVDINLREISDTQGLGIIAWGPLDEGILTGKYNNTIPSTSRLIKPRFKTINEELFKTERGKEKIQKVKRLESLAKKIGLALPELSIGYCLKNPLIHTVIFGVTKPAQLIANLEIIKNINLLVPEVISEIGRICNDPV